MADVTLIKVRNASGETILIGSDEIIPPGYEPVYDSAVTEVTRPFDFSFIFWIAIGFVLGNNLRRD